MPHHRYLIVGGGMTADAAVRGVRSVDEEGTVGLVSEEPAPPYDRPPLSKGLWKGTDESTIWRDTEAVGAELHLDRRIVRIDPDEHSVRDDRGVVYTYDRLLLATGGRPRTLEDAVPQVIYFRTLDDYRRLRDRTETGETFAVVGGGFIGSEVAAALAHRGNEVILFFPESGICRSVVPDDVARGLNAYFRERGVEVRNGTSVASVRRSGDRLLVATEGNGASDTVRVDGVVAGLGIEPNQELAATAGLEVLEPEDGGGIVVDGSMRTSAEDVYAAGDVAAVWSPVLGRRIRVEHEDQANRTGMHAGRAMAGAADEDYDHLPYFYSDLFDLGYEAVGDLDPELEVVRDWSTEMREGVLYYLDAGRVRGVLLWNRRGKLRDARRLIRSTERYTADSVRGAIDPG